MDIKTRLLLVGFLLGGMLLLTGCSAEERDEVMDDLRNLFNSLTDSVASLLGIEGHANANPSGGSGSGGSGSPIMGNQGSGNQSVNQGSGNQGSGSQGGSVGVGTRTPVSPANVRQPRTGDIYLYQNNVTIDSSNSSSGYVMVRYTGNASRVVVLINREGQAQHMYDLSLNGRWETFPLTQGNGSYTVGVFESVGGDAFATLASKTFDVSVSNANAPFLYPSQMVYFSPSSNSVALAARLAEGASSDLDVVRNIYNYIIGNISYDFAFASGVTDGSIMHHTPSPDRTLTTRTGVCFDYASLMAAMLRSQGIPTRMEVGYVTDPNGALIFHAWVTVLVQESGWVNSIQVNAGAWTLFDPTFSAGSDSAAIAQFIGTGQNYQLMIRR